MFFMILLVFGVSAQSVTVDFKMIGHEINFMNLQNSVQKQIDSGYTPVGITDVNDKLYLFYLSDNVLKIDAWKISRYSNFEDMDEGIATMISEGWYPAGYTSKKSEYFILFLESAYKASYYKVKNSEIDDDNLHSEFKPFLRTGTIPMDLDIIKDIQLYLSVQMANMPAENWKQVAFDFESETLNDEIAAEMQGRYLPWGLDITDGVLRINFIKFK